MADTINSIADKLGAKVIAEVPETGPGALGAARLTRIAKALRQRLQPGQGVRPGRPSDPNWSLSRKVPMSEATHRKLTELATLASDEARKITPMQMAAMLLEQAIEGVIPEPAPIRQ